MAPAISWEISAGDAGERMGCDEEEFQAKKYEEAIGRGKLNGEWGTHLTRMKCLSLRSFVLNFPILQRKSCHSSNCAWKLSPFKTMYPPVTTPSRFRRGQKTKNMGLWVSQPLNWWLQIHVQVTTSPSLCPFLCKTGKEQYLFQRVVPSVNLVRICWTWRGSTL